MSGVGWDVAGARMRVVRADRQLRVAMRVALGGQTTTEVAAERLADALVEWKLARGYLRIATDRHEASLDWSER